MNTRRRTPTLADVRAEGRDPLSLLGADRALLLDGQWLARAEAGAPLLFWGDDEEDDGEDGPEGLPYSLAGSVAVVDVDGPLAQRGWMCIDGYDTVAGALDRALADARVSTVLLKLNSPGGAAAGCFEWTRRMRDAVVASGKRCVAYADEMALSGAYALACVADEIVVPETGVAGSVGVIASMVSRARQLDTEGVDVRVIRAGAEKADGSPLLPIDEAAVARAQRDVDAIAAVFHRWVGERRRMSVEAVAALEAGVRMGPEAVAAGLADRVMGLHALLSELQAAASPRPANAPMRATSTRKMMNEQTLAALSAATGETDPEAAVVALIAKHAAASETVQKLSAEVASANERAASAEKRAADTEREREIEAAKAAGQWSPALEGFLGSLSVEQLRAWRASAPAVVPQGAVKAPGAAPNADAQAVPAATAALIEKAREQGWSALSGGEKAAITRHSKDLATSLRAGR